MVVELISVGTEILMGNILNSNTQYLAEKCALLGLDQYYQVTVGDIRPVKGSLYALHHPAGYRNPHRRTWPYGG